jgi:hypothetical protein
MGIKHEHDLAPAEARPVTIVSMFPAPYGMLICRMLLAVGCTQGRLQCTCFRGEPG